MRHLHFCRLQPQSLPGFLRHLAAAQQPMLLLLLLLLPALQLTARQFVALLLLCWQPLPAPLI